MNREYEEIYRVDARDEWVNGVYDEEGNQVCCEACGEDLKWDPQSRTWRCSGCGLEKTRIRFFDYIAANPPGARCIDQCQENYPFCKKSCPWYPIHAEDPLA